MRALSTSTTVADPYRAGLKLGEALEPIAPELVVLFTSIHYAEQGEELLDGLHEVLPDALVVGNTGDGFYERERVGSSGAAALGLCSDGKVRWSAAHASGVAADPEGCVRTALEQLDRAAGGERPKLLLLVSDFHADGSLIEQALRKIEVPVVGGMAGDDWRFERCFQFLGPHVLRDSIVLLGAYGSLEFDVLIGNTLRRVGSPGRITQACGASLQTVDGLPAMDFVLREIGKPVLLTDCGTVAFTVADPEDQGIRRIRTVRPGSDFSTGTLPLAGRIAVGQSIQVCLAAPEDLIAEVRAIAARARARLAPRAALLFSCGGRKELLGGLMEHEVSALSQAFPDGLPLVGFPGFGELGPLRDAKGGYTPSLFHNMTYVLLLLGECA